MTPEIQAALDRLAVAVLGGLTIILSTFFVSIRAYLTSLKTQQEARARAAPKEAVADADREIIYNKFAEDCFDRVTALAQESQQLRQQILDQEAVHEQDRARWIQERNLLIAQGEKNRLKLESVYDKLVTTLQKEAIGAPAGKPNIKPT